VGQEMEIIYEATPQKKWNTLAGVSLKHAGNLVSDVLEFSDYIA
jgi:hypothetical protein